VRGLRRLARHAAHDGRSQWCGELSPAREARRRASDGAHEACWSRARYRAILRSILGYGDAVCLLSCVLRAIGTSFDVDAFLRDSELSASHTFHRGEMRSSGPADGETRAASGFNATVSAADFDDLLGQIRGALLYLNEHEDGLRRLGGFPGVEEVCLDFAVRRQDVVAQSDLFPAELLWRAGALDIDLVVTHYAIVDEES
jgi:hypothetical protein